MKKSIYTKAEWLTICNAEKVFSVDKAFFRIQESLNDFSNDDINDICKSLKRFENILLTELERRS